MNDFYPWLIRPWSEPFFYPDDPPPGDPPKDPPKDDPPKDPPKDDPKPIQWTAEQQAELNRIAGLAREEGKQAGKTAAESAAAAAKAKADGDFEAQAKLANDRADKAEADLKKSQREVLVAKVSGTHKLPKELAELLKGETEQELDAHAKILAKVVQPRKAPSSEAGAGDDDTPPGPSNRPVKREKKPAGDGEQKPVKSYTFDRRPKVPWDQPT